MANKKPKKKSSSSEIGRIETVALVLFTLLILFTWFTGGSSTKTTTSSTPTSAPTTSTSKPTPTVSATPSPSATTGPARELDTYIALLEGIKVSDADPSAAYSRTYFKHWVDADKDGCDSRAEVLKIESLGAVQFSSGCTVSTGKWLSAYDNLTITDGTSLDIDHLVPLNEAWRSGADKWTPAQRETFANDLAHPWALIAVTARTNRSKSDQDPSTWLPPFEKYRCVYLASWVKVKSTYKLSMDSAEKKAVETGLKVYCADSKIALPDK